jgi:pimeloyl-ACP methyl ester carboxylesterase
MHFDEFGWGEPVLLLHGCPNPPDHLEPLARSLANNFRVLLAHLPGFGRAESPHGPPRISALVDGLVEGLRSRGVERTAVVGYSFGTYLSFALALHGGIEVTRLVGLGAFAHYTAEEKAFMRSVGESARAGEDLAPTFVQLLFPGDRAKRRPDLADVARRWARACTLEDFAWYAFAAAEAEDLVPGLAQLEVPVLLRVGEDDPATPPAKSERIAGAMANAELQIVPGVAHMPLLEDEAATLAAVRRALVGV